MLADVLGDDDLVRNNWMPLIGLAGATHGAPLREMLLRRSELPGFGLLPAEWVSDVVRERVTLEICLCEAADAVALAAVLAQAPAPHEAALCLACTRMVAFALRRDGTTPVPWPGAASAAAHDVAQRALSFAAPGLARDEGLHLLCAMVLRTASSVWQTSIVTLLPCVLAVLASVQESGLEHDPQTEAAVLAWLHRAVEVTRLQPVSEQITAAVAAAMHELNALPLLLHTAESEVARLAEAATEDTTLLRQVVQLLMWQLPGNTACAVPYARVVPAPAPARAGGARASRCSCAAARLHVAGGAGAAPAPRAGQCRPAIRVRGRVAHPGALPVLRATRHIWRTSCEPRRSCSCCVLRSCGATSGTASCCKTSSCSGRCGCASFTSAALTATTRRRCWRWLSGLRATPRRRSCMCMKYA
jgi:hypothetical protein